MDKTICNATEIRQNECEKIYWIQTVDDIKNEEFNSNQVVGIIAGASTPNSIIEEVKEFLENK